MERSYKPTGSITQSFRNITGGRGWKLCGAPSDGSGAHRPKRFRQRCSTMPPKTARCNPIRETERTGSDLMCMPSSARNQLRGKVETIQNAEILSHIVVRVGDNLIESVITRTSAELGYVDVCVGYI